MSEDAVLDALLDAIAPADETPFKKVLVYGDPGCGKTVFAATAPKPLFLDVEYGFESVYNHPELAKEARRMKFMGIKAAEAFADKVLAGNFAEYETIVIDTITAMQDKALKEFTIAAYKKSPNQREDAYTPEGKDYQRNTELMKHIIATLRDAPRHVILLAHVKEDKDERTGTVFLRPMLTPKLASKVLGDFGVVGYMSATGTGENRVRHLQVHPSPRVWAKSRVGGLPPVIKNPVFNNLIDPTTVEIDEEE
jgi:phage nucleotide-binding protein